jgi:hypothetical protein
MKIVSVPRVSRPADPPASISSGPQNQWRQPKLPTGPLVMQGSCQNANRKRKAKGHNELLPPNRRMQPVFVLSVWQQTAMIWRFCLSLQETFSLFHESELLGGSREPSGTWGWHCRVVTSFKVTLDLDPTKATLRRTKLWRYRYDACRSIMNQDSD